MTPADAAAYAALDLAPGTPWPLVHATWRVLVKRHHPDGNGEGADDGHRLREVYAAYAHLRRREAAIDAGPGRLVVRRRGESTRKALWDLIWDPRQWPTWMPGVDNAEKVTGTVDQRRSIRGHWGGHRFSIQVLLMGVTPPCKLSGRVLELRIDGRPVDLGLPPRVSVNLTVLEQAITEVEVGLVMPSGQSPPLLLQAALQAALVELLDLATPLELPAAVDLDEDWPQAA